MSASRGDSQLALTGVKGSLLAALLVALGVDLFAALLALLGLLVLDGLARLGLGLGGALDRLRLTLGGEAALVLELGRNLVGLELVREAFRVERRREPERGHADLAPEHRDLGTFGERVGLEAVAGETLEQLLGVHLRRGLGGRRDLGQGAEGREHVLLVAVRAVGELGVHRNEPRLAALARARSVVDGLGRRLGHDAEDLLDPLGVARRAVNELVARRHELLAAGLVLARAAAVRDDDRRGLDLRGLGHGDRLGHDLGRDARLVGVEDHALVPEGQRDLVVDAEDDLRPLGEVVRLVCRFGPRDQDVLLGMGRRGRRFHVVAGHVGVVDAREERIEVDQRLDVVLLHAGLRASESLTGVCSQLLSFEREKIPHFYPFVKGCAKFRKRVYSHQYAIKIDAIRRQFLEDISASREFFCGDGRCECRCDVRDHDVAKNESTVTSSRSSGCEFAPKPR